ncbi:cold shock domain-containing Unr isoform X2 [Rhodnius prolixus]|uniref:cold shock domain-containing Unr isoform X2 n=1 Tax=Rhodnius prolixus TaxID=13249 RepID=UPI003D187A9D
MSSNPQWKSFQPPTLTDTSIIDYKPMRNSGGYIGGGGGGGAGAGGGGGSGARTNSAGGGYGTATGPAGFVESSAVMKDMVANNLYAQTHNNYANYNVYGGAAGGGGGGGGPASNPSSGQQSNNSSTARFPIGTFTTSDGADLYNGDTSSNNSYNMGNSSNNTVYNDTSLNNQGTRETGIIEKLLHSYGFIQCCERQARLFFHFSQFSGNIEHLKIGDPVEFEMTYDRRTGKPIASIVSKIAPEVVLSEERVTGTVTTELRADGSTAGGDSQGRISYENRGECFFLPYTKDDVEGNVTLRTGDKVSFQIATNPRGNLGATHVRLENPAHPVKYQGVICSMKESFGFIERADVVKEIFFHFSEAKTKEELQLGDDVEFIIQTRNGKEVACNITTLPPGTVVFEDICDETVKGQVLKPLERGPRSHQNTDPLPGRIRYRAPDHSEVEVPFGDKDQLRDFTLRHGDWVSFRIATDRRDQLQRATNISLLLESFEVSGERRERGAVVARKDNFGFIRCADRDARIYFNYSEVLDMDVDIQVDMEVEFTVAQDAMSNFANQKQSAIRIKTLPRGSVVFETVVERGCEGLVTKEAAWVSNTGGWMNRPGVGANITNDKCMQGPHENGLILYTSRDGTKRSIPFSPTACMGQALPALGDKVEFNVAQVKRTKELKAVDVNLEPVNNSTMNGPLNNGISLPVSPPTQQQQQQQQQQQPQQLQNNNNNNNNNINNGIRNGNAAVGHHNSTAHYQGFIAALKDGFGFIETNTHDSEVFFHFSNFDGDTSCLELGSEVEYTVGSRTSSGGSCASAENVTLLPKGTIAPHVTIGEEVFTGKIVRPLRCVNPEQATYCGLITANTPSDNSEDHVEYEFGIVGLQNKRELLQVGDAVNFQVDSEGRAVNISAIRKKKKSTVDSIKGQFGFLSYELEEGKKLFFHMSEVKDGQNSLQAGDSVEFVVVTNQRNGKSFACNVSKIGDGSNGSGTATQAPRPERLMLRRSLPSGDENGPRLVVVRQPKGPSDQPWSKSARCPRCPGQLLPILAGGNATSATATAAE